MPVTGYFGLRWPPGSRVTWVEFAVSAAGRQDSAGPGDLDGYRAHPRLRYAGTSDRQSAPAGALAHAALTVALENITDEDYRTHGSGLNEPGRNLGISADYRF